MKKSKRNQANLTKKLEKQQMKPPTFSKYALKNMERVKQGIDNKSLDNLEKLLLTKRESV